MPRNIKKMNIEIINETKVATITTEDIKGIKKDRTVSMNDLITSILAAVDMDNLNSYISPLYQVRRGVRLIQTKFFNENSKMYILHIPKSNQPMPIYNRFYDNVGIPGLIFAVRVTNNKLQNLHVIAVKDKDITDETVVYRYPFTNVNGQGKVCLGGNLFSVGIENDNLKKLFEVPFKFFSMPNTGADHASTYYPAAEELFRRYNNTEFDESILVVNNYYENYKKFIEKVGDAKC